MYQILRPFRKNKFDLKMEGNTNTHRDTTGTQKLPTTHRTTMSLFALTNDLLWMIGQEANARRQHKLVVAEIADIRKTLVISDNARTTRAKNIHYSKPQSYDWYGLLQEELFECSFVYRADGYDDIFQQFCQMLVSVGELVDDEW